MNSVTTLILLFLSSFGLHIDPSCLFIVPGTTVCAVTQAPPPPPEEANEPEEDDTNQYVGGNHLHQYFISNGF